MAQHKICCITGVNSPPNPRIILARLIHMWIRRANHRVQCRVLPHEYSYVDQAGVYIILYYTPKTLHVHPLIRPPNPHVDQAGQYDAWIRRAFNTCDSSMFHRFDFLEQIRRLAIMSHCIHTRDELYVLYVTRDYHDKYILIIWGYPLCIDYIQWSPGAILECKIID